MINKLEFTNKVIDNLNSSISEDGRVELAKFIELTNNLYEAIKQPEKALAINDVVKSFNAEHISDLLRCDFTTMEEAIKFFDNID